MGIGSLPPGLLGYVLAEQNANARTGQNIQNLGGLLGLQNAIFEQQMNPLKMEQMRIALARAQLNNRTLSGLFGGSGGDSAAPTATTPALGEGGMSTPGGGQANPTTGQVIAPGAGNIAPRTVAGIDPQIAGLLASGDPGLMAIGKAAQEQAKPISTRYGIFGRDPSNPDRYVPLGGALPQGALPYQFGPNGQADVRPYPGQVAGVAAISGAQAGAQAEARNPYQTGTTPIPVLLPNGDQRTVNLTAPQMTQYNRTGQLPPEIAQTLGLPIPQAAPAPVNNPLNLRPQGASTGFRQFASPDEGLQAADRNLLAYANQGINTLAGVINRWAPPAENDTQAYIADVSRRLSLDPNQTINLNDSRVRHALSGAMMLHEQGPQRIFSASSQSAARPVVGMTQSQSENITQQRQTAAGKALDEVFAKDYIAFMNGGAQDATKQIAQLKDVSNALGKEDANLTGPYIGSTPDVVKKFINPASIAARERVEEVVQRSLRAILGAQFTEKEGERLIARAYNPDLPESENKIRVDRLLEQLNQALQNKISASQYFEKNKTLEGWQGKLPSISDFDPTADTQSSRSRGATLDFNGYRFPNQDALNSYKKAAGLK